MTASPSVRVGDVGTLFKITIEDEDGDIVDVSSASVKQIIFSKPSGISVTQTATLFTDGTDGIIQYATQDGDIDISGTWRAQGYVDLDSGSWHSTIFSFIVSENIR